MTQPSQVPQYVGTAHMRFDEPPFAFLLSMPCIAVSAEGCVCLLQKPQLEASAMAQELIRNVNGGRQVSMQVDPTQDDDPSFLGFAALTGVHELTLGYELQFSYS